MKVLGFLAGLAAAVAVAGSAQAATLVYQSTPALNGGGYYWCSDCYGGSNYQALDPFTLASSANIGGVDFVTFNDYGYNGQTPVTVEIYDSSLTQIFSQLVNTTLVSNALDVRGYNYDVVHADLTGLSLNGGQQYWISFFAPYLAIGDSAGVNNGAIQFYSAHNPGAGYSQVGDNLQYALYAADVPEPATWAMMLVGVGGLGAVLRRRRQPVATAAAA